MKAEDRSGPRFVANRHARRVSIDSAKPIRTKTTLGGVSMTSVDARSEHWSISHSYSDILIRDRCVASLSGQVVPVVFEPIVVSPREYVSDSLIAALLDCDALIYWDSEHACESFWVVFERTFAKRLGKRIYVFDPDNCKVRLDEVPVTDPNIFSSHAAEDGARIAQIVSWLAQ